MQILSTFRHPQPLTLRGRTPRTIKGIMDITSNKNSAVPAPAAVALSDTPQTLEQLRARRKPLRDINTEYENSLSRLDRLAVWITEKSAR